MSYLFNFLPIVSFSSLIYLRDEFLHLLEDSVFESVFLNHLIYWNVIEFIDDHIL